MAIIETRDLYKIYKMGDEEVHALDGVSVSIDEGEFVSVIGPSGSGKSTFMNIVGCLDSQTSGTYILDGLDIRYYSQSKLAAVRNRKIGFIFQGFNLLTKLTALENVELPLVYMGMSSTERYKRASAALERVGLAGRMKHRPVELSGGQQQRVAIARALANDPALILADEPTGNLDSKTGVEVLRMLKELHKQGSTILLITHDNHVADQARRKVMIQDGKILSDTIVDHNEEHDAQEGKAVLPTPPAESKEKTEISVFSKKDKSKTKKNAAPGLPAPAKAIAEASAQTRNEVSAESPTLPSSELQETERIAKNETALLPPSDDKTGEEEKS